jgi:hypothetical protein
MFLQSRQKPTYSPARGYTFHVQQASNVAGFRCHPPALPQETRATNSIWTSYEHIVVVDINDEIPTCTDMPLLAEEVTVDDAATRRAAEVNMLYEGRKEKVN